MNKTASGCLFAILITPFQAIFNGWVLSKLWGWFMVPTFGLPALALPAAIGVAIVIAYLTHQYIDTPEGSDLWESIIKATLHSIWYPLLILAMGWCVQQFMVAS